MERTETLKELSDIFTEILDIEKVVLKNETTANDIPEWDSLTHIQLVIGIERHFKIRFSSSEMRLWKNVGEMCDAIDSGLSKKN